MIDLAFSPTRLREIRDAAGMTREHVAPRASRSVRTLANWENGETQPEAGDLARLAAIYRCEIRDFYVHDVERRRVLDAPGEVAGNDQAHPQVTDLDGVGSTKKEHNSAHHTKRRR